MFNLLYLPDRLTKLTELRHARLITQSTLEDLVGEGNYCKAFQVLSEYLQLLDSLSEFSAAQEMTRGVEVWSGRTLHKLDSLLLGVCQEFKEDRYVTVLDAYALIGDVSGLAEKIRSFFMQEVISETHSVLKTIVGEDNSAATQYSRLTYSDLCLQTPESKFRQCLLRTLAVLFQLIYSYHEIMSFTPEKKIESLISPSPATTQKVDLVTGSSCDLLKSSLSGISQECEQWIKPHVSSSPSSSLAFPNTVHSLADVTPASPLNTSGHLSGVSFSLKERCAAVDTVSLVARILHKSKAHLQSMLMSRNGSLVEDFFGQHLFQFRLLKLRETLEHSGISKSEMKRVCGLMDCRKLSAEACEHAVQNERLPMRVIVQVLFFEQLRANGSSTGYSTPELTTTTLNTEDDEWDHEKEF